MAITQSKDSFSSYLYPLGRLPPPHTPLFLWLSPHRCLCLCVVYMGFLLNCFAFFHPSPHHPTSLTAFSLVSMLLFPFCLVNHFVHWSPHVSELIWYLFFSDWLILLSIIISRSIHAVKMLRFPPFCFYGPVVFPYVNVCRLGLSPLSHTSQGPLQIYHSFFIHSSTEGRLGCFQILAIVNNALMNIGVHIFFQISVLGFFGCVPQRIAGSKGSFIFLGSF